MLSVRLPSIKGTTTYWGFNWSPMFMLNMQHNGEATEKIMKSGMESGMETESM